MYADGARHLQDTFDSRRLADRLVGVTLHDELNDGDIELIGAQRSVLVSTVDVDGWPDVSYKGGDVGFVRVVDSRTIELPSYDGNGMFRTLGNIIDTGRVALLFLDNAPPRRLRLHGTAVVDTDPAAVAQHVGRAGGGADHDRPAVPELPPLHPCTRRHGVALRATCRLRTTRPRVEGASAVPRCAARAISPDSRW